MALTTAYQKYAETYLGSISGYDKLYLRLYVKLDSQDTIKNTSTYTTVLKIYNGGSGYGYSGNCYASLEGTMVKENVSLTFNTGSEVELGWKTTTVSHNNEGKGSIHPVGSFECYAGTNGVAEAWIELPTIPRAAVISSFSGNDINSSFNVTYTKYSDNFTHKLRISIPGVVALQTKTYTSGTSFNLDASSISTIYQRTANQSTVRLGAVIETWSGNTKIGESAEIVNTCNISNSNPTFGTPTYQDTNSATTAITGNNQIIVKDKSTIRVSVPSIQSKNSATLVTLTVALGSITKVINLSGTSTNQTVDLGTTNINYNGNILIIVTDSRGLTASKSLPITVNNYSNIAVPKFTLKRIAQTSSTIKVNLQGTFYNGKIGNTQNDITAKYRYREAGGNWSGYTNFTLTKSGNDFSYSNDTLRTDCDYEKAYEFEFVFADKISTYTINSKDITKGIPTYDYSEIDFRTNVPLKMNKTSQNFNGGVIPGTKEVASNEMSYFIDEVRLTNGQMGSFNLSKDYNLGGQGISAGWYNYLYMPHRTGGKDGTAQGDNTSYGSALLVSMTNDRDANFVRYSGGQISSIRKIRFESKVLYDNSSGSTGTITLSETAGNFNYLRIYFMDNNNKDYNFVDVYSPNGKTTTLFIPEASANFYIRAKQVTISGTSITVVKANYVQLQSGGGSSAVTTTDYVKIVRVEGRRN